MAERELDTSISLPEDEFRKTRLGTVKFDHTNNPDFQEFLLAQKMGVKVYGKDLRKLDAQEKKDVFLVTLAEYLADSELGPEKTGNATSDKKALKRDAIYTEYSSACMEMIEAVEKKYPGFAAINTFHIEKGLLQFTIGSERVLVNLNGIFRKGPGNHIILDKLRLSKELGGTTRQDLSKLRESLETESFFDGAIVISYDTKDRLKKAGGIGLVALGGAGAIETVEYNIRRLMYRDESGKMKDVDPKVIKKIFQGISEKTQIHSLLFKAMQANGRVFNPIRNAFTDITTLGIDRAAKEVKTLGREALEQKLQRKISEEEFRSGQQKILEELARTPRSQILTLASKFTGQVLGKGVHYVFWGVFFDAYHKNSYDLANTYKGLAETGLFFSGASIANKLAPGAWKLPGSLLGGGLAVVGGAMLGGTLELEKKMWKHFPERVTGDGKKSTIGHIVSAGVKNDLADALNTDLGLPGTRGGATLYNPLGKDGIMPNVDFAGTYISFGTNQREYIQSRMQGTNILWNKKMDEYVSWSVDTTMKILYEYDHNRGYFISSNGKKDELLRERLRHVFDSEDGKNRRNRQIVDDCIDYIAGKVTKVQDLSARKELLSVFLSNYGNILKIDEASIAYDMSLLERDKAILDSQTQMYMSELPASSRKFVEILFARLARGEQLVDGKWVSSTNSRGGQIKLWKSNPEELSIYQALIDDATPAKEEWHSALNYVAYTTEDAQARIDALDKKYGISSLPKDGKRLLSGDAPGAFLRNTLIINLANQDPVFKEESRQIRATLEIHPNFSPRFGNMQVSTPLGTFRITDLIKEYMNAIGVLSQKNTAPSNGDVFVYLLHTHTEYREQKRFIETQKSLGYKNTWRLL